MELLERVANLEADMRDVRDLVVKIEIKINIDHFVDIFATKDDLYEAINSQM